MKFILTIDTREPLELVKQFENHPKIIEVLRSELPDGDIIYQNLLIERKTYNDFYGSLIGGHLHDQVARMKESGKKCILTLYRVPYETLSHEQYAVVKKHAQTLNIILPTFDLGKEEGFVDFVIRMIEHYDSGEYFDHFRAPIVRVTHPNPITALYCSFPGVGAKLAERIAVKYPQPFKLVEAVQESGCFDPKRWKSKAAWGREAWFRNLH